MGSRHHHHNNAGITVIFFDLDNTLIATRKADKLACNKLTELLWEKFAVPSDRSKCICSNYLRAFRQCPENPAMDLNTWRHLLWAQALGDQYNSIAGEVYLKWLQLRYHYLALQPDIVALLNKLRQHYLLALITNGPSSAQWEKIERLGLRAHFDLILVSGDLPWEKPQRQIFDEACEYLGVEPRQCLMVGDKLETDILGGIQANLGGTVWVPLAASSSSSNSNNTSSSSSSSSVAASSASHIEPSSSPLSPNFVIEKVTDLPSLLPNNPKVPVFRRSKKNVISRLVVRRNLPDLDDCNSNGSDGS